MDLLLACIRWPDAEDRREATRACAAAKLDWDELLALTTRHRVFSLVDHGLHSAGITPPAEAAARLSRLARHSSWGELSLAGEVERLIRALQAEGLNPLVLKGIAVSIGAFGRLGLRYNRDIDLLVPPSETAAGCAVLQSAGYDRIEPAPDCSSAGLARWMRGHKDLVYQHPITGHIVELHWRLFDNPHLLPLAANATPGALPFRKDFSIPTLPADLGFLYLCAHGAQHSWSRLKWLADVGAALARLAPDEAARLYQLSKTMGVHRAVAQGMLLCKSLLGLPIPAAVTEDARSDWRIRSLEQLAYNSIFAGGSQELEDRALGSTGKNFSHYLLADGFRYQISELGFDLTDGDPDTRAPVVLLPIIRPFTWLARQAKRAMR